MKSQTYWTDLRFAFTAGSLEAAGDRVDALIEAAEALGFSFELGNTTANAPIGGLGGENSSAAA